MSSPEVESGPLARDLWLSEARRKRAISYGLISPMFLLMVLSLVVPFGFVILNSIDNREVSQILPRLDRELQDWDRVRLEERHFAALAADLIAAHEARTINRVARRLNTHLRGFQATLQRTARELAKQPPEPGAARERLIEINAAWDNVQTWQMLANAMPPVTSIYYLAAFDLTVEPDGSVASIPADQQVVRPVWFHTIWTSLAITVLCALIAYPTAYMIANAGPKTEMVGLALVILPFWTSLLVRTTAWTALLQSEGVINRLLIGWGIVDEPLRLIHNRLGVYIVMTQILLPFMILTLYGAMKKMPRNVIRASQSLGAGHMRTFFKIYLPLTYSGLGTGAIIVFITAVGFYVTPALVGGVNDQMISYYIFFYASESLNWSMAASISMVLFAFTAVLFSILLRRFGIDAVRMR